MCIQVESFTAELLRLRQKLELAAESGSETQQQEASDNITDFEAALKEKLNG